MKKIISCILLVCLIASLFVACGNSGNESKKDDGGDSSITSELDFKKEKVNILISSYDRSTYCNVFKYGTKYVMGPEKKGPDTVLNLCYDRNVGVKNALNLDVHWSTDPQNITCDTVFSKQAVLSTPTYDSVICDVNVAATAEMSGWLYNLNSTSETSHFDFTDPSWYMDYMGSYTLDENKHYMMAGDYFVSVLQSANVIFLNTEYYNTYVAKTVDMDVDDFIDVIDARQFDIDLLIELSNNGWNQTTSEPTATIDDGIGFLGHTSVFLYPFIYSSDRMIYEKRNGEYFLVDNVTQFADMVMKVAELYHSKGALIDQFGDQAGPFPSEYINHFVLGNTLFMEGFMLGDLENPKLLAMENKVAIPYPLTDMEQEEYITHISSSAEIGVILKNTSKFTPLSAYFQLLNESSTKILSQYYEYSLKFKYSNDSKAGLLLDIVHDTIASSVNKFLAEFTYSNSGLSSANDELKIIFILAVMNNTNNIESRIDGVRGAWEEGLTIFKEKFAALD